MLITGALGFIGSNFVNFYSEKYPQVKIVVLDKGDYCSSVQNITNSDVIVLDKSEYYVAVASNPTIKIIIGDILDQELIKKILYDEKIDIVIHFAAQSHVDNSFDNSLDFTMNNVVGTHNLLHEAKLYHDETGKINKFIHVSTDEVYGEVINDQMRTEQCVLDPTNPYSATKAAAEHIAKSYYYSYKLPVIITRANNVYGRNQFPEKIIPKFICQLLEKKPVTIHGNGGTHRNFIEVRDVCTAYDTIINYGTIGEIYNISAAINNEFSVKEIAQMLIELTDSDEESSVFVPDRNFNDRRYYTSSKKLEKLGWMPVKTNFRENLIELIEWYRINKDRYSDKEGYIK